MKDFNDIKIGCIGAGMMGGALMTAVAKKFNAANVSITDVDFSKAEAFAKKNACVAVKTNAGIVQNSEVIFLAVKPQFIKSVIQEISPFFTETKLVVSMAAGVTLSTLHSVFGGDLSAPNPDFVMPHIIRIMPNLPATVGEAMIALSPSNDVSEEETALVKTLLDAAGKAEVVPEKLMDGVTAVSGSGPAYAFLFIEALADAAVRFGMPRAQAYTYAAQTLRGAATMALEDGRSISELKDAVCSPAGTTIEGVVALEKHNFRAAVIDAATAAYNKSVDLGRK
ncbi:MAG TPA: pyrroline-5-carboxylate reductase [Treponema sp.]|jgi:pyrroline-5-carboxylate reductase|nr:pyrroline-5-carboxylate reductase [Treponema sp.]HBB42835.1 pyrroline-5-carboxylate reductase [Treponema sp.]